MLLLRSTTTEWHVLIQLARGVLIGDGMSPTWTPLIVNFADVPMRTPWPYWPHATDVLKVRVAGWSGGSAVAT